MYGSPQRPEEGTGSPGTEVIGICELLGVVLGTELLTMEPSLQPILLFKNVYLFYVCRNVSLHMSDHMCGHQRIAF